MAKQNNQATAGDSYSHQRSASSVSKTSFSSTRHSMEAAPESPTTSKPESESPSPADADAIPPYKDNTYENKDGSGLVRTLSKREYAIEISRMMGKQLVKSVNGKTSVESD
ncbi:hypothetical protein CC80DRAFT_489825 [Byssothecium circinans]|uniref:Uncharacterized protein n=1 Tax=Byssothecium circinans TaxID=147558 RepID=A0A6A5U4X8_9PLEO|nr:hypothetical protein CC80DRAFT_489825 [Byssothecium circinans]